MSNIIRVGCFFDGTGEDAYNLLDMKQCNTHFNAQINFEQCNVIKKWNTKGSSYRNSYTNIFRLFCLYSGDIAIYIEGTGTEKGKRDKRFPDEALGAGKRGIVAKAKQAITELTTKLANITTPYNKIILDIFGFSRGAASARHFANEVYKNKQNKPNVLVQALNLEEKNIIIEINFIGLFDTVTALGTFKNIFDIASSLNPGINLYLPPDIANKVFQLKADNEYRQYFSLNSVLPEHQEVGLYGAHADVGGGYTDEDSADVDEETTIQMEPLCIDFTNENQVKKLNQSIRNSYANYKAYLSSPDDMSVHEQQWQEPDLNLLYNKTDVLDRGIYFTVMHRKIKKNFELLAGDLMRVVAVKHNVPFKLFSDHYIIPDELKPVCESYYQQIEKLGEHSGSVKVSQEKERLLFCHYIHCSDSWNTQLIFFYPNKPHLVDGRRIRYCYENKPQKNYPVQMF